MYFAVAIMKLSETKFPDKNSKFERLYLEKYMCEESGFLEDKNRRSYYEIHENWVFQMFKT